MRHFAILMCLVTAACGSLPERLGGQSAEPHCAAPQTPQPSSTAFADGQWGSSAQRDTVRKYIRRLMDETRIVPDTAAKKGGPRGSPGSYDKLTSGQVDEFITSIIKGAELFLPKSLSDEQRWALVCAEISIESAFQVGTSGVNPGDGSKVSVGPLQLTLPQMWDDIFRQYANLPGLTHYDGSPWDTKTTDNEALKTNIHDGVIAALWCITEQGRRGCPDWFGGPDGPCPKTWKYAQWGWVIGAPALKSGGDLAGQKDAYIAIQETELKMLGFDPKIMDAPF